MGRLRPVLAEAREMLLALAGGWPALLFGAGIVAAAYLFGGGRP